MQPPQNHSRVNLAELKAQLVKKIGPDLSKQYFYYLNRFLSLKLNKIEFNKLCIRIIGRENLPLHNKLILSILKNACTAKTPPAVDQKEALPGGDIHLQNGLHSGLPNGVDILPLSPRKTRTRRPRTTLGPNGKSTSLTSSQLGDVNAVLENGVLSPRQHHQGLVRNENEALVAPTELLARSPLRAPLGVPFYPGGAHVPSSVATLNDVSLLDNAALRERMEQIALMRGLEGVSLDCANVLNHGLDAYLKGLIRSCIELVGSRSGHELSKSMKLINGVKPGHHFHLQNSERKSFDCPIYLQDFRVAMELNPLQLGEDSSLLLEKICMSAFEEEYDE